MGTTTAYSCDGPGCDALTTREAGKRWPNGWLRATLHPVAAKSKTGSFHDSACLQAWIARELGVATAAVSNG